MGEIKGFVEAALRREERKDHLFNKKEDMYVSIVRDLVLQARMDRELVDRVMENSGVLTLPEFAKLKSRLEALLENTRVRAPSEIKEYSSASRLSGSDKFFDFGDM